MSTVLFIVLIAFPPLHRITPWVWNGMKHPPKHPYKIQFTASPTIICPAVIRWNVCLSGNQGQYGTCVAYASAYGLRTIMLAKDLGITDKYTITQTPYHLPLYSIIKREDGLN